MNNEQRTTNKETRALVTGGAGFIGSHLCAALLQRDISVLCVDNFQTGSRRNVAALLSNPRFELLEHDAVQLLDRKVDLIFHLASPASVPDYLSRPLQTLQVNSAGTVNMLEMARKHGAKLLFTSTSEIYGDPLVHPQPESYWGNVNPAGPRAVYDESKRFGEAATMAYRRVHNVDARIVRIFNTYGPHSRPDDGRIVPNFINQALRREPITIYGNGTQTRSFCYVSDMVAGIVAAMFTPATAGEIFNLGNPAEYSVNELARLVAQKTGSEAGVAHRPLPIDDPTRRCPDITKARTALGWQPEVDLNAGLNRTIEWFERFVGPS
jgi:nucleoside-diphosphate-sugar epimerase